MRETFRSGDPRREPGAVLRRLRRHQFSVQPLRSASAFAEGSSLHGHGWRCAVASHDAWSIRASQRNPAFRFRQQLDPEAAAADLQIV